MSRKSATALATVTNIPGQRPEPPVDLSPRAADEWRAVVARMPFDWFTRENQALLVSYCANVCQLSLVRERLADFDVRSLRDNDGLVSFEKLSRIADMHVKTLANLATRMRMTQQSRYRADKAITAVNSAGTGRKPWDTDGKVA